MFNFSGPLQSERSHCCGWSRRGYRLRQINCPTGTFIVYPYFCISTPQSHISTLKDLLIADMAVRLRVVRHGDGADPGDPLLPGFQEKDRVSEADRERSQGPRVGRQAFDPGQK